MAMLRGRTGGDLSADYAERTAAPWLHPLLFSLLLVLKSYLSVGDFLLLFLPLLVSLLIYNFLVSSYSYGLFFST